MLENDSVLYFEREQCCIVLSYSSVKILSIDFNSINISNNAV